MLLLCMFIKFINFYCVRGFVMNGEKGGTWSLAPCDDFAGRCSGVISTPNDSWTINPFTAMVAALSLRKRPIKIPNLKSARCFFPYAWARERISIKVHSIESRFVTGPSDILFACMYVCTFQPGNFTSWGIERGKLYSFRLQKREHWLTEAS